jgi:hypothetical protein
VAAAEVYDPAGNKWMPAGALAVPRILHAAALLPNGDVLVVGDGTQIVGYINSAELYDPQTNAWSSTDGMLGARAQLTAVTLADGRVLVACGFGNTGWLASAELFTQPSPAPTPASVGGVAELTNLAATRPGGRQTGQQFAGWVIGTVAGLAVVAAVTSWSAVRRRRRIERA